MHVVSDDASIYFEVAGEGPAVVLLHPFPANHSFWDAVVPQLTPRYRVLVPDLRGAGESGAGEGPATMEKHAADLARVCDEAGAERAAFVGVSIGGYVLLEFWRRHRERVAALVLCDTRATPDTSEGRNARLKSAEEVRQHGPAPFIQGMLPKLLGDNTRSSRPDVVTAATRMLNDISVGGIVALQHGMAQRPDSVPTLKTITVPTLIVVGDEDTLTPPADAELMHKEIPGSRLAKVPRAGHFTPFEQPQEFAKLLRGFLDALPRW